MNLNLHPRLTVLILEQGGGRHKCFVTWASFSEAQVTSDLGLAQVTEAQLICAWANLFVPGLVTNIFFCTCARHRFICASARILQNAFFVLVPGTDLFGPGTDLFVPGSPGKPFTL